MRKNLCLVIVACLLSTVANAQEWVSFGSRAEGSPPEISVQRNDNQQVSFTVGLSGMYVESRNEAGSVYKRLSMPECQTMGEIGSPEIPVVIKMVAIPECSDIVYSVTMSGVQTFSNYVVYPVPDQPPCEGDETFMMNSIAYSQNQYQPSTNYEELNIGALRSQRYVQLELHPVQYNPVTQTLTVATEMEVTLSFVNATTPVNVGVGIFNNVATNTMVNFVDQGITAAINDKAFEKSGFQPGTVQWKRLSTPSDVENITADYLIICADVFFSGSQPHTEVQRIANHRKQYNGFDVLILNADDIISDAVGFSYEGQFETQPTDEYKKEQRIRTCIRTIYETGTANHTMDGKLAYVLLIGDVDEGNTGMPTSYDHNNGAYASDYYYSCITKVPNTDIYDDYGDLFIGRFGVPNNLVFGNDPHDPRSGAPRLKNMVTKTINYEQDWNPGFKERANIAYGGDLSDGGGGYGEWYAYIASLMQNPKVGGVNAYPSEDETLFRNNVINMLNDSTLGFLFSIKAHGNVDHWWGNLSINNLQQQWINPQKQPFCVASSCLIGKFDDHRQGNARCLAEDMTSYSDSLGFIGMLAASSEVSQSLRYHFHAPTAIFKYLSHITGEFVLASKAISNFLGAYTFNLFGDPALNLMAEGYVVMRPTKLDSLTTTHISCNVTIKQGGNLIIPGNSTVWLDNYVNITIEKGGKITMGNNSKITSFPEHNPEKFIEIQGSPYNNSTIESTGDTAVIENINFQTALSKGNNTGTFSICNITFSNVNFTRKSDICELSLYNCHFLNNSTVILNNHLQGTSIKNSTFTDTKVRLFSPLKNGILPVMNLTNNQFTRSPISHRHHKLNVKNCEFSNRSDIVTTQSMMFIEDSHFSESGVKAGLSHAIPVPPPFTPAVWITHCSFRDTGKFLSDDGELIASPVYSTASIMLSGINEFRIVGNTIVNVEIGRDGLPPGTEAAPYGEGIYLNYAGKDDPNNRMVFGNEISRCEIGVYVYNSKATFKNNNIHHNTHGVRLFNNSSTSFLGEPVANYGEQKLGNNASYQLYASQGAFPVPFKYNQIHKDNNPYAIQWIYYDAPRANDQGQPQAAINVMLNCWGDNFVPATDLYPTGKYIISPTWCPGSGGKSPTPAEELYQSALDYFIAENYTTAKTTFINLIETYPESELATAALHELFALEQFLSDDYAALRNYYTAFTPADSTLFDVTDFLATRCNVVDRNWQPAIDWYEDRIANPPSYPDSVFAVIDLGDIHLAMESDTLNLKSGRVLRFPGLIPKSKQAYEENKAELLATLPKTDAKSQHPLADTGKKGVLSQNIPNPAKGSTTIVYDVIEEGQVELRVYNQLGQLLQLLPQGTKKEGTYRIEISLAGLPAGMYYYSLLINGERADAKKMIVN
ncbi:MAG: C25 family cysteine peptidase [Bacteroidales bacterium]|nr:C25 family cysteine peptidase [Bacteroidales bacterium]